ncbi:894_t:CDS:1 [Funneliformis caledonium]|uniref:894_t:CDS:1 n=1 Tax=Funneliformis caledonium TaxID=1117310 RepID=A0A9N9F338_9GLOM|nr:894_t:CDS:1 [Funneliformis caledonium]
MKFNLLLMAMFAVFALAKPLAKPPFGYYVERAFPCDDVCLVTCRDCCCAASKCSKGPVCKAATCSGVCSETCTLMCGECNFNCQGCVGTPPICKSCTAV